jgi:hypothetical protein
MTGEYVIDSLKGRKAFFSYFLFLHEWGRGEVHTGLYWGNLREVDHLEDPDIVGRIILNWIFER